MFASFQKAVFKKVAEQLKLRFPHRSLELVYPDDLILQDLDFLKTNNKLLWNAGIKSRIFTDLNESHPIKLVVYYRGEPIGYAFGGFNQELQSVEVGWMEKRNDAHEDLDHQMLGIVLDAYSAYALFLNAQGHQVNTIAMVSPVEGAKRYYLESNFAFDGNYKNGASAMILTRATNVDE